MPVGKLAAQAGHAYLNAYLSNPIPEYQEAGLGTKVCLGAKDDRHIVDLKSQLDKAGIPSSLIVDSGHILPPHFDGNPIITALGFGPCTKDQVNHITRKLKLL